MEVANTDSKQRKFFSAFRKVKPPPPEKADAPKKALDLPYDIIVEIVQYLGENYVLKLCLLSRSLFNLLVPALYSSVDLRSSGSCRAALKRLVMEPHLATHMRKFVIRPNNPSRWANEKPVDESWVVAVLEQLASAGQLENLHTFIWDGVESPIDSLWLILRLNCPHLRTIGTCVGLTTQKIDPGSHLFDFRDLLGFSLVTQKRIRWTNIFTGQLLPDRLWDMLLVHSPHLIELTLDGTCLISQLWNTRRVFSGRWRSLRSLSLGNVSTRALETDTADGATFIKAHPALEKLAFFGNFSPHTHSLSTMPLVPLPRLRVFSGKISQLKELTGDQLPSLWSLRLTDHFSPAAKFDLLREFPSVVSLAVCVNFLDTFNGNHAGFFERLLSACAQLTHVEISSTSPFSLYHFSAAIHHTPHLLSFILTLPRKRPAQLAKFSLQLTSKHTQLQEFTIRDVHDWDHEDQLNDNYRLSDIGVCYVLGSQSQSQSPRLLRINESGLGPLGRYSNSMTRPIPS
ncbi:hypothetical protein B0H10DRAFT_2226628 [Mycena sp. CBHHK59/15]|nr:hypothetical protein B0H10DRAFT_2226628 [Mycena sp. CBHHK59/15]